MMTPPDRSSPTLLRGSVLASFQFDVCEEIRFDLLQQIVDAHPVAQPTLRYPTPGYIRYERPPLVETIEIVLESGEKIHGQIKYYDYGVLSVVFRLPFEGDWETLIHLAGRSVWIQISMAMPTASFARNSSGQRPPSSSPIPRNSPKITSSTTSTKSPVHLPPIS